jgi:hypothetical protein
VARAVTTDRAAPMEAVPAQVRGTVSWLASGRLSAGPGTMCAAFWHDYSGAE